jgi:ATP/maltotriose-dependent transcriptional regulator MalT
MKSVRNVTVDKTARIEEMLPDCLAVCLSGMPGMGRKTAVRVLLDKHPEVNAVFCSVGEIEDGSALERRTEGCPNWYLVRKPEGSRYPDSNEGFRTFVRSMPRTDRIILAVDGLVPESFLELIWEGVMSVVMPESFWFTEEETYRYLKECGSALRYREVYYMTGGWAGCIAMMVRLAKQLKERWSAQELGSRYEIRKYIRQQILATLPEDELNLLKERAAFPSLDQELEAVLWEDPDKDLEERLFVRGALVYVPESDTWHVQPALRMAMEEYASPELCARAVAWYESKGQIQNALTCCWYLQDSRRYRECLIRNYDKVPFLNYERSGGERDRRIPQLLYLEWMELFLRQDMTGLAALREQMDVLAKEAAASGADPDVLAEICLNIAYTDPWITTAEWMRMLRDRTTPGRPVRLYFMLGESVSYLSGLRDLSDLFACGKKERKMWQELWEERLAPENQIPYRLAQMEYEYQTDSASARGGGVLADLPETDAETPWQIRLGTMYLAYLYADGRASGEHVRKHIRKLADSLDREESQVCRWNARALLYLAEARWGERDDLMQWIRETDGEIENDAGKTRFYMAAEVKVNLYLGNYGYAESILEVLIPYFERSGNYRWLAEALFQLAVVRWGKGEKPRALEMAAKSLETAGPYRYVRIYTGYGIGGAELLREYKRRLESARAPQLQGKKKYRYGSVLNMTPEEWLDYIIRKASRQKKHYPDLSEDRLNIYRAERLTATELIVLRYLEEGYSNAVIGGKMNIRLSTVKSHVYNIFRKLGVTTRLQAVQKARENGILQE